MKLLRNGPRNESKSNTTSCSFTIELAKCYKTSTWQPGVQLPVHPGPDHRRATARGDSADAAAVRHVPPGAGGGRGGGPAGAAGVGVTGKLIEQRRNEHAETDSGPNTRFREGYTDHRQDCRAPRSD